MSDLGEYLCPVVVAVRSFGESGCDWHDLSYALPTKINRMGAWDALQDAAKEEKYLEVRTVKVGDLTMRKYFAVDGCPTHNGAR